MARRTTMTLVAVPAVIGLLVTLAACGPGGSSTASGDGASTPPPPAAPLAHPVLTSNAQDSLGGMTPVTVSTDRGRLSAVSLRLANGHEVSGRLAADGASWSSAEELPPGTSVTLTATEDASATAASATMSRTFTTGAAAQSLTVDVTPWGQQVVGIGQPIVVRTNRAISTADQRAATTQALQVKVNGVAATGAWHWVSDTEVHYREQGFWPAHSAISVSVALAGLHLAPGVWGSGDRVVSFRTGRSFVMAISDATHQMTVTQDGAVVRTVPVSMGRPGYATRSGIKTIMSHERTVRMTSSSYGGADYYDEIVHDAMRLTNSGEYIHSAPWSVASQGHENVSHGCVNVSPENAAWLYTTTLVGDPVVTTGTDRSVEPGNGTGADWDVSWGAWTAASGS